MGRIKQLLIIDDDKASRRLIEEVAKELFVAREITTCSTGFQALSHIKEHCMSTVDNPNIYCPELILLDISMPVIDGYEFLAELYSMEGIRHNNTSVFFVSTIPYKKEQEKAKFFPVLGYIEKPLTSQNLAYALKNILPH